MAINVQEHLERYPEWAKSAVVVLSGGMDSAIAARMTVEKYGAENVHALSFFYGQKQSAELECAKEIVKTLGVAKHQVIDIRFLGEIVKGATALVDDSVHEMPDAEEVGDEIQPITYVPSRNVIFLAIAASYAESNNLDLLVTGALSMECSEWDATADFIHRMNDVLCLNRKNKIRAYSPLLHLSKSTGIEILRKMDGNIDLLKNTLTCYNPHDGGVSCGVCVSCGDRIKGFKGAGVKDPIEYAVEINWEGE